MAHVRGSKIAEMTGGRPPTSTDTTLTQSKTQGIGTHIEEPVVPLERNLCGHLLAALLRKKVYEEFSQYLTVKHLRVHVPHIHGSRCKTDLPFTKSDSSSKLAGTQMHGRSSVTPELSNVTGELAPVCAQVVLTCLSLARNWQWTFNMLVKIGHHYGTMLVASMYCTVLNCIVLNCIVLNSIVLKCTELYWY